MKTHIPLLLLAAVAIALLPGCGTLGPLYPDVKNAGSLTAPKDKGLVILYQGGGANCKIYGNDQLITTLRAKSFYTYITNPGPLTLSSTFGSGNATKDFFLGGGPMGGGLMSLTDQKKDWVTINVAAGQVYYVETRHHWRDYLEQESQADAEKVLNYWECDWENPNGQQGPVSPGAGSTFLSTGHF